MLHVRESRRARVEAGKWILLAGAILMLAGCGGQEEEAAPPPRALLPAALQDTVSVDTLQVVTEAAVASDGEVAVIRETIVEAPAADTPPPPPKPPVSQNLGPYSLQLGSFRTEANARSRMGKIQELGYNPAVEKADIGGIAYYRVVLRGLETREKAGALGEKIRTALDIEYLVRRTD